MNKSLFWQTCERETACECIIDWLIQLYRSIMGTKATHWTCRPALLRCQYVDLNRRFYRVHCPLLPKCHSSSQFSVIKWSFLFFQFWHKSKLEAINIEEKMQSSRLCVFVSVSRGKLCISQCKEIICAPNRGRASWIWRRQGIEVWTLPSCVDEGIAYWVSWW
jgi:hypothetical protein